MITQEQAKERVKELYDELQDTGNIPAFVIENFAEIFIRLEALEPLAAKEETDEEAFEKWWDEFDGTKLIGLSNMDLINMIFLAGRASKK